MQWPTEKSFFRHQRMEGDDSQETSRRIISSMTNQHTFEQNDVELRVFHATNQDRYETIQVRAEDFFADGLLGERQPEFAGLESDGVVGVLSPQQHVLHDLIDVRDETVHTHFQQHDQRSADVFSDFRVIVGGEDEQILDKRVDVHH